VCLVTEAVYSEDEALVKCVDVRDVEVDSDAASPAGVPTLHGDHPVTGGVNELLDLDLLRFPGLGEVLQEALHLGSAAESAIADGLAGVHYHAEGSLDFRMQVPHGSREVVTVNRLV
jgi:hypothetical protein